MYKKFASPSALLMVCGITHADDKVDFAKQVRPIFADSCYKCHAEKKQKGKLRLDSVDAIVKGGKDGKIFEAGNPDKSDLYHRLTLPKDSDDVMPPEGDPLPKDKQDLIKKWIAEGASFGDWKSDAGTVVATSGPADSAGPVEPQLPQVPVADAGAMEKIRSSGAIAMPLAQNTNLIEVDLNLVGDHVDDGLPQSAPVAQQIASLNLARTKVTDEGLKAVEPLKNLRRLHLENTKVGDAALPHLKDLPNLEYLNLYGTAVTDSGLTQLEGLKTLHALYLWQTKVTPAGVDKLKAALPKCEINLGWEQPAKTDVK